MELPENSRLRSTALICHVAARIRAITDAEAATHEAICASMTAMSEGVPRPRAERARLVEDLQFYDGLQQRIAALCVLTNDLARALERDGDPTPIVRLFCATAPVVKDALWLNQLHDVGLDPAPVATDVSETWLEADTTQPS